MNYHYKFIPLEKSHLPLMRSWLTKDHVKPYWQEPEDPHKFEEKFLSALPQRGVHAFVIEAGADVIGYIQYYHAPDVGGGWWQNESQRTFGIDVMIGEERFAGKGLGSTLIKEFILFLCVREKNVESIIIDPDPSNKKAIRAFEKAGFQIEREIETPNGKAILMRLYPKV
jgi:aminoglycoside 6'-N-acetyltransferase